MHNLSDKRGKQMITIKKCPVCKINKPMNSIPIADDQSLSFHICSECNTQLVIPDDLLPGARCQVCKMGEGIKHGIRNGKQRMSCEYCGTWFTTTDKLILNERNENDIRDGRRYKKIGKLC